MHEFQPVGKLENLWFVFCTILEEFLATLTLMAKSHFLANFVQFESDLSLIP